MALNISPELLDTVSIISSELIRIAATPPAGAQKLHLKQVAQFLSNCAKRRDELSARRKGEDIEQAFERVNTLLLPFVAKYSDKLNSIVALDEPFRHLKAASPFLLSDADSYKPLLRIYLLSRLEKKPGLFDDWPTPIAESISSKVSVVHTTWEGYAAPPLKSHVRCRSREIDDELWYLIRECISCRCGHDDKKDKDHLKRLGIRCAELPTAIGNGPDSANFDAFFDTATHKCKKIPCTAPEDCRHQVQFLVLESSPAGKALDEFDSFHQIHPLATPLCNELERNHCKNVKIRVEKVDNSSRLYASKEHQSAARELSPIVSLTLNELLVTEVLQELKPWQKYTLSYFVALAIWQYYDTKWMPVPWSREQILFVQERFPTSSGKSTSGHPYITPFSWADRTGRSLREPMVTTVPRRSFYPKLMALGILLIEIFSSKRYSEQDQLNPNEEVILQNYIDYCDLVSRGEQIWHTDYQTIINRCFDSSIFKKATDTQGRRDIIWEKIVLPLEQLYRNEVCIEDFQTDLYEAQFASQDFPLLGSNSPVYFPQSSTEILPSLARGLSAGITQDRVNAWQCTQFRDVNHIFVQLARQRSWERIKIAVIDTGFSLDAAHFKMFGRDEAKRVHFKDFVDVQNTSPIDTDHHDEAGGPGHGTLVVTLLLKLLPKAIIYVARVVETRAAFQSEDSPRRIAEAIRWVSLHESTQVHVVSLSFGFENNSLELGHEVPERCDKIAEAIIECRRERKYQLLFFAAAGNDGMDSHEMFPASMHRHVISVRGTELSGGFDDQYNPAVLPGRPQDLPLYGILANEVPCDGGIRMSGTSVATPLLAATAVLFLQYSSWITQKHSVPPGFASRMYEMRSMTKLFREIGRTKGEQIQRNARYALVGVQPRFFFEDASLDNVDTWSEKVWNAIDYWP